MTDTKNLFGLVARYESKRDLIKAVRAAREKGYKHLEAYSPFPIEELDQLLGNKEALLPWVIFGGAVLGGLTGFFMQYTANVFFLQLDIGGRPYNSWPAFIPITFELTILFAAIAGFLGVIIKCGLPELYHSVFNTPQFERVSQDSFFLCVMADDPQFNSDGVHELLQQTHAKEINSVEV